VGAVHRGEDEDQQAEDQQAEERELQVKGEVTRMGTRTGGAAAIPLLRWRTHPLRRLRRRTRRKGIPTPTPRAEARWAGSIWVHEGFGA
jgi:hypothetical protein